MIRSGSILKIGGESRNACLNLSVVINRFQMESLWRATLVALAYNCSMTRQYFNCRNKTQKSVEREKRLNMCVCACWGGGWPLLILSRMPGQADSHRWLRKLVFLWLPNWTPGGSRVHCQVRLTQRHGPVIEQESKYELQQLSHWGSASTCLGISTTEIRVTGKSSNQDSRNKQKIPIASGLVVTVF